jgi:hypothetical protein
MARRNPKPASPEPSPPTREDIRALVAQIHRDGGDVNGWAGWSQDNEGTWRFTAGVTLHPAWTRLAELLRPSLDDPPTLALYDMRLRERPVRTEWDIDLWTDALLAPPAPSPTDAETRAAMDRAFGMAR